jgi:16S rRNA (guanine527-N7)-methyltransferase
LKGVAPSEERERLPQDWKVVDLQPLWVPRLQAERHLVFIERAT